MESLQLSKAYEQYYQDLQSNDMGCFWSRRKKFIKIFGDDSSQEIIDYFDIQKVVSKIKASC